MINPVHKYIKDYAESGADIITIHPEATDTLQKSIDEIKKYKKKVGLSLNPDTKIEVIEKYLDQIDLVLVMSVFPGFGGQKFIKDVLKKIEKISEIKDKENFKFDIEVDGGINFSNFREVLEAGANVLVSGTTIFKENNLYLNELPDVTFLTLSNKMTNNYSNIISAGINAVSQIIHVRPKSIETIFFHKSQNKRIKNIIEKASNLRIDIIEKDSLFFDSHFTNQNHQKVAISCNQRIEENEQFLESLLDKEELTILILEGITDPHNVGACLRSAAGADVDAVIVPKNRSCHLTPVVRKISTGASELIPFVVVTNLVRTINKLQKNGLIVYGADLSATESHDEVEYSRKKGIVIGSEDKGIRKLTRDNCDQLVKINMSERIESLNASVSAGILLFEMRRQIKINSQQI